MDFNFGWLVKLVSILIVAGSIIYGVLAVINSGGENLLAIIQLVGSLLGTSFVVYGFGDIIDKLNQINDKLNEL